MELGGFVDSIDRTAFVPGRGMLNIASDKQIIVTNACYIEIGSIVILPNGCAGRSLIFKRGAVSAKPCECCSEQENRRTAPSVADRPKLFRHRGDVQPGHQPALSGRAAVHAAGLRPGDL